MAAKSPRSFEPNPRAILEGLCRGLAGPKPFLGKDALFPATAPGKQVANAAVEQGLVTTRKDTIPPTGKKGKPKEVVVAELTDKGRQYILAADSPKAVLEALLPAVKSLNQDQPSQPDIGTFRAEMEIGLRDWVQAIEGAFAKLQKPVEKALKDLEQALSRALPSPAIGPILNPGSVLAVLESTLVRVSVPPRPMSESITSFKTWYDRVVQIVAGCKRQNSFDRPPLPRVYEHLKRDFPQLTIGEFHEGLRELVKEERIRLTAYTQALATLPDAQNALYMDREVKYYVDLP